MKAHEFINEADSYQPPELNVGDKILKGKFKNSPAEIKGFTTDKHNQPVLKTNKGDVQLFKPRVEKLMKESLDFEQGDCPIFAVALHKLSGLPIMALVEYNEEVGDTVLIHAYVRYDSRWCIDSTGVTDVLTILAKYPNDGNAEEIQINAQDLLNHGYGKSKCPTLQVVMPYAEEAYKNAQEELEL